MSEFIPRGDDGHVLQKLWVWSPETIEDIQIKAELGRYRIRGFGMLQAACPRFDDLTFIPCSLTRIPLEGYREQCNTTTVLGTRLAARPIELRDPDHDHRHELRRARRATPRRRWARRRRESASRPPPATAACSTSSARRRDQLVYEVLPSRYGFNSAPPAAWPTPSSSRSARARSRAPAALLLGSKVSAEIARHARPAAGRRPALPVPAPRLPRARRHGHQDRGAARGDRLAGADLRQARRLRASTTTSSWPPRPAPTWWWSTAWKGGTGASPELLHGPHRHPHPGRRLRGARGARGHGPGRRRSS